MPATHATRGARPPAHPTASRAAITNHSAITTADIAIPTTDRAKVATSSSLPKTYPPYAATTTTTPAIAATISTPRLGVAPASSSPSDSDHTPAIVISIVDSDRTASPRPSGVDGSNANNAAASAISTIRSRNQLTAMLASGARASSTTPRTSHRLRDRAAGNPSASAAGSPMIAASPSA